MKLSYDLHMLYIKLSQHLKMIAIKKLSFVKKAQNVFKLNNKIRALNWLSLSVPKNYEIIIFYHYVEF